MRRSGCGNKAFRRTGCRAAEAVLEGGAQHAVHLAHGNELAQIQRYRHQVINRDVPQAVGEVCEILLRYAQESPCSMH